MLSGQSTEQVPSPCQNMSFEFLKSAKQLVHYLRFGPSHVLQVGLHCSHLAVAAMSKYVPPGQESLTHIL